MNSIPTKRCTKCGNSFPATTEYFFRKNRGNGRYGLFSWCKTCHGNMTAKTERSWRTIPLPGFRYCRTCEKAYTIDEFTNDKSGENGKGYVCIYCNRKRANKWNRIHPAQAQKRLDKWKSLNPERAKAHGRKGSQKRRAHKRHVGGTYILADIEKQYDYQHGLCYWCSSPLKDYQIDHVIPISRGGSNSPDNLVCACTKCNKRKFNKLPYVEWQPPNPLFPNKG